MADDAAMGVTEVVRGADLLMSTARQILLFRALGLPAPHWFHCRLVVDHNGRRLAKRHDSLSLRALRRRGITPMNILSAELPMDGLRAVLETNLVSAVRLAQLARPHLADHGGFVAFIGSFYADLGVPGSLAYSASKAALASVTRTLAVEWAAAGIAVVNFAPGYVETELNADYLADPDNRARIERRIPVGRVGTAAEIGRLIVAVLTADCRFLTGETITIDGAQGRRL